MLDHLLALQTIRPQALTYFAEIARTGSLRMAAQKFNVAPSAISRQIGALERELDLALFERSSRGMAPTHAGRILLGFLVETESRLVQMYSDIDDLNALKKGTVRLAVVEAVASDFLPQLMIDLGAQAPGIDFQVQVCGTHQIADRVADESADIGMAFNVLDRDDLVLQGRIQQPLQLICRPGHALAARGSVTLAELGDARVALPMKSFGIRYLIDQAASRAGVRLAVMCEADSLQMLKAIVHKSDVVSFMPPLTFAHEVAQGLLCGIDLRDGDSEHASIDIITSRRHTLSAAARFFLATLLRQVR